MPKSAKLSFHVRHEVRPNRVVDLIRRFGNHATYDDIVQADRQITRAKALGLIAENGEQLTDLGETTLMIIRSRPNLWGDIGHFLHYTLWDHKDPSNNSFSWMYRQFSDYLFTQTRFDTNAPRDEFERLTAHFSNLAETEDQFASRATGGLSLSPDSFRGIIVWLEALQPPVIENKLFSRRSFCPPELLLLAFGYLLRDEPQIVGVDILLSRDRRDQLCRLCLLEPNAFDQTLDWMLSTFPTVIQASPNVGFYGRGIRLSKPPEMKDLLR